MNTSSLREHIKDYLSQLSKEKARRDADLQERSRRKAYFQSWTAERIASMTADDIHEYVSRLWAMRIWGNKRYVVDKMIVENGLDDLKSELSILLWGSEQVSARWDRFRTKVRHLGPAMMSELLCHVHPDNCMLWNRRAYVAYRYLEVADLPRYDYQLTGLKYEQLSAIARQIAKEMEALGANQVDLLTVDYFIWDELQVEDTLSQIHKKDKQHITAELNKVEELDATASQFVHEEIKQKRNRKLVGVRGRYGGQSG
jgi:hypothetical protein